MERVNPANWRKSTYSSGNGGNCVEAGSTAGTIAVRDTTDRTGPVLAFSPQAWREFTRTVTR